MFDNSKAIAEYFSELVDSTTNFAGVLEPEIRLIMRESYIAGLRKVRDIVRTGTDQYENGSYWCDCPKCLEAAITQEIEKAKGVK